MINRLLILSLCLVIILLTAYFVRQRSGQVAGINTNDRSIKGVIIPHHEVAKELIHSTLKKVREEKDYKYIVIIGPNHFYPDSPFIVTATELPPHKISDKVGDILKNFPEIGNNINILLKEHSIQIPLKYINEYFPNSEIIPLVISSHFSEKELMKIARYFYTFSGDTLFIASVDFSHESTMEEGKDNNSESINSIINFDYQTLYAYKDDHMDSPLSLAILMKIMQSKGANWETWFDSHSSILENTPTSKGTSYVLGVFR